MSSLSFSSDLVMGVHVHVSGKQQSREMQETRAAAWEENREAARITRAKLGSQHKILLTDAWRVDKKLSTI